MQACEQHIKNSYIMLSQYSTNFFGAGIYDDVFENGHLSHQKLKTSFPSMNIVGDNEETLTRHISSLVEHYYSMNIFQKIWWRLTRPVTGYLVLNEILTLKAMHRAITDDSLSTCVTIYRKSTLSQQLNFFDRLTKNWRFVLEELLYKYTENAKKNEDSNNSDHEQPPSASFLEAIQLNVAVDQYLLTSNATFKTLGHMYLNNVDAAIMELEKEHKKCLKIIQKVHPDKNRHIEVEATQCSQKVTKIKDQIKQRLDILNNKNHSQEIKIVELLKLDFLTAEEYAVLNKSHTLFPSEKNYPDNFNQKMSELNRQMDDCREGFVKLSKQINDLKADWTATKAEASEIYAEIDAGIAEAAEINAEAAEINAEAAEINAEFAEINAELSKNKLESDAKFAKQAAQIELLMAAMIQKPSQPAPKEPPSYSPGMFSS